MDILTAFFLGIVQGLTEFLPVSSSGHLTIFQTLLGTKTPPLLFDIWVHMGTFVAVVIYFRRDLPKLFQTKLKHLVVGTVPAVILGLFIYNRAQSIFSDLHTVGLALLGTSLLLYLASMIKGKGKSIYQITIKQALIIGVFQALAIIPGLSRSGATIASGLLVGLSGTASFAFSFALSLPAILGAFVLSLPDLSYTSDQLIPALLGFFSALIVGLLCLRLLNVMITRSGSTSSRPLIPFVIYTFILGSLLLGFSY